LRDRTLDKYIVLSVVAAAMLSLLAWMESLRGGQPTSTDRLAVGGALAAACVFGLLRSVRPGGLRMKGGSTDSTARPPKRSRVGHHPDCGAFASHVLHLGTGRLCAGCAGLAIGSLVGLAVIPFYVLTAGTAGLAVPFMLAGFVLIAAALLETARSHHSVGLHIASNAALVFGFIGVTVGATELSASMYVGVIAIVLSFLWLDTRIMISEVGHARTCARCPQDCKAY
jgi:hypothetical protein